MNRWALLATFAAAVLLIPRRMWNNILNTQRLREDPAGSGAFGAPRGGHTHQGIDLLATMGEPIMSPIAGRVVRIGYVYDGDVLFRSVVLQGEGLIVKLFYIQPLADLRQGNTVQRGQVLGTAQAISTRYPQTDMLDHVHIEARRSVGGELLNPAHLLSLA